MTCLLSRYSRISVNNFDFIVFIVSISPEAVNFYLELPIMFDDV